MQHHGSGEAEDSSNLSSSHCILVMGTNSTEGQALLHVQQLALESRSGEDSIVSVAIQSSDSKGSHLLFASFLGSDGLSSSEVDNQHDEDMTSGMVLEG